MNSAGEGEIATRQGWRIATAGYGNRKSSKKDNEWQNGFLMLPYPLTKFEIQRYYQNHAQRSSKNETSFNGVYSRDNLPKIKNRACAINLDDYPNIGTQWIA